MKLWEVLKALDENPEKVFHIPSEPDNEIGYIKGELSWLDPEIRDNERHFIVCDKRLTGYEDNISDIWEEKTNG